MKARYLLVAVIVCLIVAVSANAQDFYATSTGSSYTATYTTLQGAINSFGAPGVCGIVYIPQGTFGVNITINHTNTCTDPSQQLIIKGAGRRNTFLKPAANGCVLTIDSTAGSVQGVQIEDIGFDNTGTGFSNNAICIIGSNINDQHLFRRVYINGFNNAVYIPAPSQLSGLIAVRDSSLEVCAKNGINASDFNGFEIDNVDMEANGSSGVYSNVLFGGTFARGFHIHNSQLENSTTGDAITVTSQVAAGVIDGNFLTSGTHYTVNVSGVATGTVQVGCNFEAFTGTMGHNFALDGSGSAHAVDTCNHSVSQVTTVTTGTTSLSAIGASFYRFAGGAAATITNFNNGQPGQVIYTFNESAGNVTFQFAGTGGFYFPSGSSYVLPNGAGAAFIYSPNNQRWIHIQ